MKKILVIILTLVISSIIISTAFAGTLEDPVFDYVYATFNAQGIVSFTIYTTSTVPSITISSCELQKLNSNGWETITSNFTLTNVYFDGDCFSANVNFSGSITTGQYKVKYKPKANNHTITCYTSSRTF